MQSTVIAVVYLLILPLNLLVISNLWKDNKNFQRRYFSRKMQIHCKFHFFPFFFYRRSTASQKEYDLFEQIEQCLLEYQKDQTKEIYSYPFLSACIRSAIFAMKSISCSSFRLRNSSL